MAGLLPAGVLSAIGSTVVYAGWSAAHDRLARAAAFLERHPDWTLAAERRLSPLDGGDGFFIARFRAPARRA